MIVTKLETNCLIWNEIYIFNSNFNIIFLFTYIYKKINSYFIYVLCFANMRLLSKCYNESVTNSIWNSANTNIYFQHFNQKHIRAQLIHPFSIFLMYLNVVEILPILIEKKYLKHLNRLNIIYRFFFK